MCSKCEMTIYSPASVRQHLEKYCRYREVYLSLKFVSVIIVIIMAKGEFPDRIVSNDGKEVQWSAKWPSDVRVEFLGATNISLRMRCDFTRNPGVKRKSINFCFEYRRPPLSSCGTVHAKYRKSVLNIGTVSVSLTFDPKSDIEVFLEASIKQELPLSYAFFREQAGYDMITSNRLFLLDLRKNFPKDLITRSNGLELNRNAATSLKCLEKPLNIDEKLQKPPPPFQQPVVPVKFEWFFCSGDSLTACEASKKPLLELENFTNWPAQVRADGELYVPFVPNKIINILENKRLICFMMGKPTAFYKSPLKIVEKTTTAALAMVRPKGSEKVILYDSVDFTIRLPCDFNISPGQSARVTWSFKNGFKTETLSPGSSRSDLGITVCSDGSALIFKGLFAEAIEGTYSCTVTSGGSTVKGSYKITYTGPPRLDPSVSKRKLVVEGGSAKLVCKYQQSTRVSPSLSVCGDDIDFQSKQSINVSVARNNCYKPTSAIFSVEPVQPKRGDIVRYIEIGMKSQKNSSHYVTCIGYQPPFSNRKRIVFMTVPKPKVSLSCPLECKVSCHLKCEVTSREQIEAAGGEVLYSWSLLSSNTTASVPGIPIGSGSVLTYQPEEEGTQTVRCTAQLRVRSSEFRERRRTFGEEGEESFGMSSDLICQ